MVTSGGSLTALQKRVLDALGGIEPPFVLSGGGALAGVYLGHREARDLDLFWRNHAQRHHIGGADILVDAPQAILVEKLCALLAHPDETVGFHP